MKNLLLLLVALFICLSSFAQNSNNDSKEEKALFNKTLREASRDANAAMRVAKMYFEGTGTDLNRFNAFDWYKKAINVLDDESRYRLAILYFEGEVTPSNPIKAQELLKPLIASGYQPAIKISEVVSAAASKLTMIQTQHEAEGRLSDKEFHKVARTVKEVWPTFPGGKSAMDEYITSQTSYPEEAIKRKMRGEVIIQATIDTTGRVTKVRVLKKLDPNLEFVALRAIRFMPRWNPGYVEREYKGETRRQYSPYIQVFPIIFQLPESSE